MAILARILLDEAPRLCDLLPAAPARLDELVARMLAKDPAARPRDGAAVAIELAALGSLDPGAPVLALARPALTGQEQRLLSVVVVPVTTRGGAPVEPTPCDTPLPTADTLDVASVPLLAATAVDYSSEVEGLRAAIAPFGAELTALVDGSLVVVVQGSGAATDQTALVAHAALALRDRLGDAPIGVATGRGLLAAGGVVGEVIDRAVALAGRGLGVHLDETTARLLDGRFVLRGEGAPTLVEPIAAPGQRTLLGRPTPFVGRERELAKLVEHLDECREEQIARVVLVTGPPGIGKSRLRSELSRIALLRDAAPWVSWCEPMRSGSPLALLTSIVRSALGLRDGMSPEARRERLSARLAERLAGDALSLATIFLGELCGAPPPEGQVDDGGSAPKPPVDDGGSAPKPRARRWGLCPQTPARRSPACRAPRTGPHGGAAPARLPRVPRGRVRARAPLCSCSSSKSSGPTRGASASSTGPSAISRSGRSWWSPSPGRRCATPSRACSASAICTRSPLRELGKKAAASERLVREVLGAGLAPGTVDGIVARAGGNAFFLEELIRAEAEGRGGALPETVLAMAQARLERLPPDARQVLRAASVLGEVFWSGAVAALLGGAGGRRDVDPWLDEMTEREVVTRRPEPRFPDEREYVFRHALVRDAAYASLTEEDRALGHRIAGDWLDARGEPDAAVLAEHFDRGRDAARAAGAYERAASQALARSDFQRAMALVDRAIAMGAAGTSGDRLGRMRLVPRARARRALARWADARHDLAAALDLTPAGALEGARRDPDAPHRRGVLVAGHRGRPAPWPSSPWRSASASGSTRRSRPTRWASSPTRRAPPAIPSTRSPGSSARRPRPAAATCSASPARRSTPTGSRISAARALRPSGTSRWCAPSATSPGSCWRCRRSASPSARAGATARRSRRSRRPGRSGGATGSTGWRRGPPSIIGGLRMELYDLDGALAFAEEARAAGQALAFPPALVSASLDALFIYLRRGDAPAARALLPSVADAVGRGTGWHGWLWTLRFAAAKAELALVDARPDEALAAVAPLLSQDPRRYRPKYHTLGLEISACARVARGEEEAALADLDRAADLARGHENPLMLLRPLVARLALGEDAAVRAEARGLVERIEPAVAEGEVGRAVLASEPVRRVLARPPP